ncbi:carbamate kinase [Iocasia frigidifontis]|uniref:Carbamate kinase n=1 Tax=Iocasia fonsfrigidae TaxID=2682810 RepID=A0A8A7KIV1_9FIRM|nr:carbamate kinase [Iocasia fonsfrigidae]QTL99519.1 carbamate kinase [Iocasia fonsfrigidae]
MENKSDLNRIVIALGGNALGNTPKEQQRKVEMAAKSLVDLISQGNEILICHGNGPQVGMINLAFEEGSKSNDKIVPMELPESIAMSQGYIGYHLQKAIKKELYDKKMPWHVATVVTQIEVDEEDEAFQDPKKPIGSFYTKREAEQLIAENEGLIMKEDAGRGYRRMVPSPLPKNIVEKECIINMLDNEFIVIACGGGGIPVVKNNSGEYKGVPAVIDKDFASAKLADAIDADYLFILTAVDKVSINWGRPNQKDLDSITVKEAEKYCKEGHFASGSMLPKVKAAIKFVKGGKGRRAVIASLEKASLIMQGKNGTVVHS